MANAASGGDKPNTQYAVPASAVAAASKETGCRRAAIHCRTTVGTQNASSQDSVNSPSAPKQIDSRQMLALLAELQSAGAIDAATQQELLDDLKQTDPALWPQLIRQFRTAIAYRQHMAARCQAQRRPASAPVAANRPERPPPCPRHPRCPPALCLSRPNRNSIVGGHVQPDANVGREVGWQLNQSRQGAAGSLDCGSAPALRRR